MIRALLVAAIVSLVPIVIAQDSPPRASEPAAPKPAPGPKRKPGLAAAPAAQRVAPVSAARMLDARLLEVSLHEAPLDQALIELAEKLNVNILVRWDVIDAAGVARDTPISIRVRNIRVGQALWLILNQAAGSDTVLAWRADDELITISTAADFGEQMIVRVYDVQDIIAPRLAHPSITIGREREYVAGLQPRVAAGAVGVQPVVGEWNSGVQLIGEDSGGQEGRNGQVDDPEARMRELVNVITATLEPDSWDVNGGRGSVRPFRGRLVVRNTLAVHQMLGGPIREP